MARPKINKNVAKQKPTKKEISKSPKKVKKKRTYQVNKIRLVIWIAIFLFIGASVMSIVNSRNAMVGFQKSKQEVARLQKEVDKLSAIQAIDIPTTDAFLKDFLTLYFSVSDEREKELERREQLTNYYTALDYQTTSIPQTKLQVNQIENYGYQQDGKSYVGTFFVETKTVEDEPKYFKSIVGVRFKLTKNGYQIGSLPFQMNDSRSRYITPNNKIKNESRLEVIQDTNVKKDIQSFVEQFLHEYQENNSDNLQYLMEDVEGLPENVSIEMKDINYYHSEEQPIVNLTLVLTYKETGIKFNQGLELHMVKREDGKYFVKELIHY